MPNTAKSLYGQIDTPALLIDRTIMLSNIKATVAKARAAGVKLRPHTKTHRMPQLAQLCLTMGASGITVAKVGEAEVMAENGLKDIFIANEVIGESKYQRIKALHEKLQIAVGIDNIEQAEQIEKVFAACQKPLQVLMEIEVGEVRTGVSSDEEIVALGRQLLTKSKLKLVGVFSHEGHCYKAKSQEDCQQRAKIAHNKTIHAGKLLKAMGHPITTISVGSTPSLLLADIAPGITEIRPGTFILMDVGQGSAIGDFSKCAATVLASVISRPTPERVVVDAGAKSLTSQNRTEGICTTYGYGLIKNSANVRLKGVFDEHGVIENAEFRKQIQVGDKVEIIPNHICPTCNLYDKAYLVDKGKVLQEIPILGRGRSQ